MGRCLNSRSTEMEEFNEFIDMLDLVDVLVVGGRFTWSNKEGNAKSRLDRFLLSDGLIDDWKIVGQRVGDMDILDHVPIWLIANDKNWGPKPFRVNNCWFENKDFKNYVEEAWNDLTVVGRQDFVMKEKLKLLKSKLRVWNKEKFGWIDLKIEEATTKINRRDQLQDGIGQRVGGGMEDEIKKAKDDLWKHLSLKENLLRQKSRQKWIKEGDQNTKYFHHSIKERRRRNNIVAVTTEEGGLVEDVESIRKEVLKVFAGRFKEGNATRPSWDNLTFNVLSAADRIFLESEFTMEEITKAEDILKFVKEFHRISTLSKAITVSFIALIPKNANPQGLNEHRPICLRELFVKFGFSIKWCKWMEACIFNSSLSILVNGSPTKDFWAEKGLRQGDPLSPFLFTLVVEGLAVMFNKAAELGSFDGFQVSNNLTVRILQFADDTVIVGRGCWKNLWTVKSIFRGFELISGLKVNFSKSKVYGVNLQKSFMDSVSQFLSCCRDVLPFKFLGIFVGSNPRRCESWRGVLRSLKKKLSLWKCRFLSIGGRVTLLNSVLSSIPIYTMSFFKAPVKIIKEIITIQSRFLWCG
ncbi:uncharacterized protein LOC131633951 [Vicia villosa]|uniref:uncharacterized protein LOC131633951 n=1 Tax=Vicia villosa TaxID=3911 RepID=UPI00273B103F|nr:uncharacterized protein LOC131633951 [Vicia villosa]